jgi:putative acetyltransferase
VRWTKAPPIRRFFFAVTSPPVQIRVETPDDATAVARVVEAAFGRPDELRMVEAVRASDGFVPELAFVADDAGEVVGHVMLSTVGLVGSERHLLELAPLAVAPARQRAGIGSALTRAALAAADARNEPLVLVLGDPRYYVRFGFRRSDTLGLEPPEPAWHAAFMVAPLAAYEPSLRGKVVFPPSFSHAL